MTTTPRTLLAALALALLAAGGALPAAAAPADPAAAARGARAYGRYCVSCHGVEGDGRGPSAESVDPRPRNFTGGTYKFRSTPAGELPADDDILRTIERGLHGTSMPHWKALTPRERRDLVQYLKVLSPRFAADPQGQPIAVPPRPSFTPELVAQGKEVWNKVQCAGCHGETGKGDGASAPTLRDEWGFAVAPKDFTSGPLKVGDAPEDLYRAFMTGLTGSPMPSFAESISPDEAWALVAYVRSLRKS
jgi:cytochrome c oxidase cbb3-type subunit I/II